MKKLFMNLKVKYKLALMLTTLVLFIQAIGSIALYNMDLINSNLESISKVHLPSLNLLLQADRDMHQALVAQRTMFFTDVNSNEFQSLVAINNENIQQTYDRWGKFKDVKPDEIEGVILKNFEHALDNWVKTSNRIVDAIKIGTEESRAEAIYLSKSEGENLFSEAREFINQLTEQNELLVENDTIASEESYESAFKILLIGMIIITLISIIGGVTISNSISKPLISTSKMMLELRKGHLSSRVDVNSKDEIGILGTSMNEFADNLQNFISMMYKVADGDLSVEVPLEDEKDEVAPGLNKIVYTLRDLQTETESLILSALDGKLDKRGNDQQFNGVYKSIVRGFNDTLNAILEPLNESAEVLRVLATGDFRTQVNGDYKGDHQLMKDSINTVIHSLNETLSNVNEAVSATASASTQISASSEEMAVGAQEQSSQASEVAAAVEQMTATIMESTQNISTAAEKSKDAGEIAIVGGQVVEETIVGMNRIAEVVKQSADIVKELGKSSDQIGAIIQVINDIADQTNLLALNAAIEAARAGEQGRGFAVVADEVKKLAERTTTATQEIAEMIKKIQKDTTGAVKSIERGTDEVEKGKELAGKAGESLESIIESTNEVVSLVSQVAVASEEQSATSEQISQNIEGISNVAQESALGVEQIAHASEDLNKLTENLQELVQQFKIKDKVNNYSVKPSGQLLES